MADRAIAPGTGITFTGVSPSALTINAVERVGLSFNSDSSGYYRVHGGGTLTFESFDGTGTLAYAYSTNSGSSWTTVTLPATIPASTFRATLTGCTTFAALTLLRT